MDFVLNKSLFTREFDTINEYTVGANICKIQESDRKKEGHEMKKIGLYAAAVLGNVLLINLSERWYGAAWFTEWLFGLVAAGFFALFLLGWKRYSMSGIGLVIVMSVTLFTIDSIFFVQNLPAGICSFLLGLLLIPYFASHRDAVLTAVGLVFINILINLEVQSEMTMWLVLWTAGVGAIIGFRLSFLLLKVCFTLLFSIAALVLLLINLFGGYYLLSLLLVVLAVLFIVGTYKLTGDAPA